MPVLTPDKHSDNRVKAAALKSITVCADDFSLNAAINDAVLKLLQQGSLSATSCMTQSPTWHADAQQLLPWRGVADLGVHINFTHAFPGGYAMPLPLLMASSALRLINRCKILDAVVRQLDAFEDALGCAPDFIDGHQHVHIFPVIRDCLLDECLRRYSTDSKNGGKKLWLRTVNHLPTDSGIKGHVLQLMGAGTQQQLLQRHGLAHNTAFAGLYNLQVKGDLQADAQFDQRMRRWLHDLPAGGLIMCHPASSFIAGDAHPQARVAEYDYFSSNAWRCALADNNIVLTTHV